MPSPNYFYGRPWMLALILSVLPACSAFPQLVRHSDPLSFEQHIQLATAYEAQGLNEAAGQQYDAALRIDNKFLPALIARGNLAYKAGDFKKAEACYRQVLRRDRNDAGANNNLAMVYLASGKNLDKAEHHAQLALRQGGPLHPYVQDTLEQIAVARKNLAMKQK